MTADASPDSRSSMHRVIVMTAITLVWPYRFEMQNARTERNSVDVVDDRVITGFSSITVPITREETAPVSTVMDETFKIAMTRLGSRIRVGGMAELSGFSHDLPPRRQATLKYSLNSLFPGAGALDEAKFWTGLRPMTPDGTPVLGATRVPNLYLNTGHGTLGWTMACGSARVVSDIITGREPEIEAADLSIARY